jgi:hypothetical protein
MRSFYPLQRSMFCFIIFDGASFIKCIFFKDTNDKKVKNILKFWDKIKKLKRIKIKDNIHKKLFWVMRNWERYAYREIDNKSSKKKIWEDTG